MQYFCLHIWYCGRVWCSRSVLGSSHKQKVVSSSPVNSQQVVSLSKAFNHNSTQVYIWVPTMLGKYQTCCGGGVASPTEQKIESGLPVLRGRWASRPVFTDWKLTIWYYLLHSNILKIHNGRIETLNPKLCSSNRCLQWDDARHELGTVL